MKIGSLAISVSATAAPIIKKFKQMGTSVKGFGKAIAGAKKLIIGMGVAITALAFGGLVLLVKNALKSIDVIAKLSDTLGVSTEALAAWELGATLTGSSTETLHKSLPKLAKAIGEAQMGLGQGKEAFKALGLEVQELANMGLEDAFIEVAEAIAKQTQATTQLALANLIFGRSGGELLNFLKLGKSGMDDIRKSAERLGILFSRTDAKRVEDANDALTRMSFMIKGIGRQLAIFVAPYITFVVDKFTEWATKGDGVAGMVVSITRTLGKMAAWIVDKALWVVSKIIEGVAWITSAIGSAIQENIVFISKVLRLGDDGANAAYELGQSFHDAARGMREQAGGMRDIMPNIKQEIADIEQSAIDSIANIGKSAIGAGDSALLNMKAIADVIGNLRGQIDNFGKPKEILNLENLGAGEEVIAEAQRMLEYLNSLTESQSLIDSLTTPVERYEEAIKDFKRMFELGTLSEEMYNRAVKQADEALKQAMNKEKEKPDKVTETSTKPVSATFEGGIAQGVQRAFDVHMFDQLPEVKKQTNLQEEMVGKLKSIDGKMGVQA